LYRRKFRTGLETIVEYLDANTVSEYRDTGATGREGWE